MAPFLPLALRHVGSVDLDVISIGFFSPSVVKHRCLRLCFCTELGAHLERLVCSFSKGSHSHNKFALSRSLYMSLSLSLALSLSLFHSCSLCSALFASVFVSVSVSVSVLVSVSVSLSDQHFFGVCTVLRIVRNFLLK